MPRNRDRRIFIFTVLLVSTCQAEEALRKIMPTEIDVREGEDIQVYLTEGLHEEASCYVKTPKKISCNLKVNDSDLDSEGCGARITYWSPHGECGFRVTNVSKAEDSGKWRLTATNTTGGRLKNEVMVTVLDRYDSTDAEQTVLVGYPYTLTFSDVEDYCLVQNPHSKNQTTLSDLCHVDINKVTGADEGSWTAVVGVSGQVHEMIKTTKLNVFHEHLNVGYKNSSDFKLLQLYCNLIARENSLELCRFSKSSLNQVGFRLKDGLRSGRYSYYGNGLSQGDCGMTIEYPEEDDFGQWYCLVATNDKYPFGASLYVNKTRYKPSGDDRIDYSVVTTWSKTPVLTTITKDLDLECFSSVALSYCWFMQPNGEVLRWRDSYLTPESNHSEDLTINYAQEGLASGKCKLTIAKLDMKYNGTWSCHMGPSKPGPEISHNISVRIAETPLAAINKLVYAEPHGKIALKCKTVPRVVTLRYCRFYSPKGYGININEKITEDSPIRENNISYWFTGKGINTGDCGIIIDNVNSEHNGEWTCAARLEAQEFDDEAFDTIYVQILENITAEYNDTSPDLSTANLTVSAGIGIGAGIFAVVLAIGSLTYLVKKRLRRSCLPNVETQRSPTVEFRPSMTSGQSILRSIHSDSSETSTSSS